jgi:hypothetical protein
MQKSKDSCLLLKGLTFQNEQNTKFSSSMYSTVHTDKKIKFAITLDCPVNEFLRSQNVITARPISSCEVAKNVILHELQNSNCEKLHLKSLY